MSIIAPLSTATSGSKCQKPYWKFGVALRVTSRETKSTSTHMATSTMEKMPSKTMDCDPEIIPKTMPSRATHPLRTMENERTFCSEGTAVFTAWRRLKSESGMERHSIKGINQRERSFTDVREKLRFSPFPPMKPVLAILILTLGSLDAGDIDATSLSSPGSFECAGMKVEARENAGGAIDLKLDLPGDEYSTTRYSTTLERKSGEPFLVYWDKDSDRIWSATPTILMVTKFSAGRSEGYRYDLACGLKELHPPAEFVNKVRAWKIEAPARD